MSTELSEQLESVYQELMIAHLSLKGKTFKDLSRDEHFYLYKLISLCTELIQENKDENAG